MCATCGCSGDTILEPHEHDHEHQHEHGHVHGHSRHSQTRTVTLEQAVLARNDALAEGNRKWLAERSILAVNLMSSPGAGKTTLLERTIRELGSELRVSVVEGDQETVLDADRIRATGAPAIQINTGSGCHLDAKMLFSGLRTLDPPEGSVVLIENVGNLVCPALFDLGEQSRVVITSVTEGAEKPRKYPQMFRAADLVLLNKVDLLPYVKFDIEDFLDGARRANPDVEVLQLSATTGEGVADWYGWLRARLP
jgi:hydrogenase nickel incorporation protein HypB